MLLMDDVLHLVPTNKVQLSSWLMSSEMKKSHGKQFLICGIHSSITKMNVYHKLFPQNPVEFKIFQISDVNTYEE